LTNSISVDKRDVERSLRLADELGDDVHGRVPELHREVLDDLDGEQGDLERGEAPADAHARAL
jgi:hypothetical protein